MCGRYALYKKNPELRRTEGRKEIDEHGRKMPVPELPFTDRWNISPTQRAPVIRQDADGARHVDELRWGLVPFWAKDLKIGAQGINARVETASTKPMFRAAWKSRRCLVPASGFYEWTEVKPKQPWFFRPADDGLLFFAGLWETWTSKETGEVLDTYTVLTREPYEAVRPVHDRSPVALPSDAWGPWLGGEIKDAAEIANLPIDIAATPVGTAVSNPRNEGPGLIAPITIAT